MTGETLVAFLNARLEEDASFARATMRQGAPPWAAAGLGERIPEMAHIERHSPARTLREVEAKRAILAEHQHRSEAAAGGFGCSTCHFDQEYGFPDGINWCGTVRSLVSVYSDHPDYDPAWAASL